VFVQQPTTKYCCWLLHLSSEIFLHAPKDKRKSIIITFGICMFHAAIQVTRQASLFCTVVNKRFFHVDKNESLFLSIRCVSLQIKPGKQKHCILKHRGKQSFPLFTEEILC